MSRNVAIYLIIWSNLVGLGCAWLTGNTKPLSYGGELALCAETQPDRVKRVNCCVDVARKYSRDPGFCIEREAGADGGQ